MIRLRFDIPLGIVLSLALILTGSAGALARTVPAGATLMVLCSGGSAVSVLVDESGQPVERAPLHDCRTCPFCGPHADALPVVPFPLAAPRRIARPLSLQLHDSRHTGLKRLWRRARGPPKEN